MTDDGLGWYLRRLRGMSPQEVGVRFSDAARRRSWARRQVHGDAAPSAPADLHSERGFGPALPPVAGTCSPDAEAALLDAADRVLAGTWTVLGAVRTDSADPDWFFDPVTGRRAPDRRYAFGINHRDEVVTGNIKQVWEMSRHHQVTVLAAAWWVSGQERYAQAAADQLRSWWRANPFLSGVHWTSGIEVGVRLIAWAWVRRLLDDWPKVGDLFENNDDALRQIAWHQEYLSAFRSTGSSANNHVIAEAAGQLVAACAFAWFERSDRWRDEAARLLEKELAANTFVSGLNRELASDYHRFVIDLALVAALEADAAGHPLSDGTWGRLARMLDAGVAVLDVAGRPPRQGDGDEGQALVVDDPERDPWAVTLGSGAAVLGATDWWPAFAPSVRSVLLGALSAVVPSGPSRRQLDRPAQRPRRFADAGCVLLVSRPGDGPEIWCRCDAGPHGFLSIAAHAHADALSVEVRHDGVDILTDPGTYCYHGEPEWRSYFRSTAAHNTLEIGGIDQARSGGPFLWTTRPRTSTLACIVGDQAVQSLVAEHDGYQRLATPATHRREVVLDSPARLIRVTDTVEASGRVPVRLSWHLGPEIVVKLDGAGVLLRWIGARGDERWGQLSLPDDLEWSLHRGEEDPPLGWYSPGFGRRVPAAALIGRGEGSEQTRLVTTLTLP